MDIILPMGGKDQPQFPHKNKQARYNGDNPIFWEHDNSLLGSRKYTFEFDHREMEIFTANIITKTLSGQVNEI